MRATSSYIDVSIISQRDRTKNPISYLEKVQLIFTRMMPMDRQNFVDQAGKEHVRLECRRDQDFTAFINKWSVFFDTLMREFPNPDKFPLHQEASRSKNGVYLVLKIQTNLTRLVHYLINLANGIYPLIGLRVYYESVADGLITYIQEESDFETFLRPLSNERIVREYYQKLGIKSEDFFARREKILNKTAY